MLFNSRNCCYENWKTQELCAEKEVGASVVFTKPLPLLGGESIGSNHGGAPEAPSADAARHNHPRWSRRGVPPFPPSGVGCRTASDTALPSSCQCSHPRGEVDATSRQELIQSSCLSALRDPNEGFIAKTFLLFH